MIQFEETADSQEGFCLRSAEGDTQPVFAGVEAKGRLEGVLFALTLRQTYRNAGTTKLEVIYTFPLPSRGVLLGFAAELDGKRQEGCILPRRDAEQTYEDALADGDAPVMLEVSEGGLHTANIGNLQPGEQIVLEIRTAQLLAFEQGQLRLAIPTTIAPRHGNPARAGLLPHQVPQASLEAEYPLSIELSVLGSLAESDIDCPTHSHRRSAGEGGVVVALAPGVTLDRDVVFLVTPAAPRPSLLVHAADTVGARAGAGVVALAAFSLPAGRARPPARLKLLVDCSGSMMGDSMASAHRALHGVLDGLRNDDAVSFSRFGDRLDQVLPMSPVSTQLVAGLRRKVDATTASLGGTEMAAALLALIKGKDLDPQGPDAADRADILLITDGEVWDVAKVVEAARHSGHRVFAIGMGSAPAEAVLAQLAESTGGACEFATPGEALESAAVRMLTRIRQVNWSDMRVDWGVAPRWQVALPRSGYGGDTVLALAGFGADQPALKTARFFASAQDRPSEELAAVEVEAPMTGDSLARIAAARRLASLDSERGMEMALAYSLLSDHTHCLLVHRRSDKDKVGEEAQLHRVSSMLAAGWGGTGTVMPASASRQVNLSISTPSVWRSARSHAARTIDFLNQSDLDFSEQQAPPTAQAMKAVHEPSLLDIGDLVVRHFNGGGSIQELSMGFLDFKANPALRDAMRELQGLVPDESLAWLMLALWVSQRPGSDGNVHHASLLARHVGLIDPVTFKRAEEVLYRRLGAYPSDSWASARATRLRKLIRAEGL